MELPIIFENDDLLAIDKPGNLAVFPEGTIEEETLIDILLKEKPFLKDIGAAPRYGIIHRLDKETSGIILIAKNNQALDFFQNQFKKRTIEKKYLALVFGKIKEEKGTISAPIGRAIKERWKQRAYPAMKPGLREALTEWTKLEEINGFTLIEAAPKTGRKHQIRVHLSSIGHPIMGDKLYSFKDQPKINGLNRQFLHASYLKVGLKNNQIIELKSNLSQDLKQALEELKEKYD